MKSLNKQKHKIIVQPKNLKIGELYYLLELYMDIEKEELIGPCIFVNKNFDECQNIYLTFLYGRQEYVTFDFGHMFFKV